MVYLTMSEDMKEDEKMDFNTIQVHIEIRMMKPKRNKWKWKTG